MSDSGDAAPASHLDDFSRLLRILALLSEPSAPDILLERVLAALSELFSSDIVALVDPVGTGSWAPLASVGLPEEMARVPLSDAPDGAVSRVLGARAPLTWTAASAQPLLDAHLRELGGQAAAWLPVAARADVRGVLLHVRCRPAPFAARDVDLLTTIAYRIGLALEQAQGASQLAAVERYGREVAVHLEAPRVGAHAVEAFRTIMRADAAVLALRAPDGGYECVARAGVDPAWEEVCRRVSARVARDSGVMPYQTSDIRAEVDEDLRALIGDCPARALLAAPLRRDERTLGLLYALRFAPLPFSEGSARMATLFAAQTSAALENSRLYAEAQGELAERRRAEAERGQLQGRLQIAQRMEAIGTFAAGVAHDFNNLLFAITGNLELMRDVTRRGSKAGLAADRAMNAALQAADLVRRFMTFASGGGGIPQVTDTRRFVRECVSVSLLGSGAQAEYVLADDLWNVEIDTAQMSQALGAIVTNAVESMPRGGTVTVKASNEERREGTGSVRIDVSDHGTGIAPPDLKRVFDPYFSTKERGVIRGMGLGLAVALSIVTRHHGHIDVRSEKGVGTTFSVVLPAVRRGPAEATAPREPAPRRREGRARVLLLEDEDSVAVTTVKMLHRIGIENVERASEGGEAVEMFTRARAEGRPFHLLVLDLTVRGGMGGVETLQKIHEIDPQAPAIACSGYSGDPVISRFAEFGFSGSLPKPYRMADLRDAIARLMPTGPA